MSVTILNPNDNYTYPGYMIDVLDPRPGAFKEGNSFDIKVTLYNVPSDQYTLTLSTNSPFPDFTISDDDLIIPAVEFAPGEYEKVVTIQIKDDGEVEGSELGVLMVSRATNSSGAFSFRSGGGPGLEITDPAGPPTFKFTQNFTEASEDGDLGNSLGSLSVDGGEGQYSFTLNTQLADGQVVTTPGAMVVNADDTSLSEGTPEIPVDGDQVLKVWYTADFDTTGVTFDGTGFSSDNPLLITILDTDGSGDPVEAPEQPVTRPTPPSLVGGGGGGSFTPTPEAPAVEEPVVERPVVINAPDDLFGDAPDDLVGDAPAMTELEQNVSRLYLAAFERLGDEGGLTYWNQVAESTDLEFIANEFIESREFSDTYGELTNLNFVGELYDNVLGRAGDASGTDFWVDSLNNGTSRANVLLGFADSGEARELYDSLL